MALHLQLRRWYVGLHGLATLRGWPYEDTELAEARMRTMRELIDGPIGPEAAEVRIVDELSVDEAYDAWADTYDEPNPLIMNEEAALRSLLAALPRGLAADVGAGTGRVAAELVTLGHRVIAIDGSSRMLERARERVEQASLLRAELDVLPFGDASVDLLVCGLALTHRENLERSLRGFARVVRPGGHVVTSDVHPMAVALGGQAFFRRADGSRAVTRNHVHWPSAYVGAATAAGLEIVACEEPVVNEELLDAWGADDLFLGPETAMLDLPFSILWVFRKPDVTG